MNTWAPGTSLLIWSVAIAAGAAASADATSFGVAARRAGRDGAAGPRSGTGSGGGATTGAGVLPGTTAVAGGTGIALVVAGRGWLLYHTTQPAATTSSKPAATTRTRRDIR